MTHRFSSLAYKNMKVYQDGPMTPTVMDAISISFQLLSMCAVEIKSEKCLLNPLLILISLARTFTQTLHWSIQVNSLVS